jgi:hypothetical protein
MEIQLEQIRGQDVSGLQEKFLRRAFPGRQTYSLAEVREVLRLGPRGVKRLLRHFEEHAWAKCKARIFYAERQYGQTAAAWAKARPAMKARKKFVSALLKAEARHDISRTLDLERFGRPTPAPIQEFLAEINLIAGQYRAEIISALPAEFRAKEAAAWEEFQAAIGAAGEEFRAMVEAIWREFSNLKAEASAAKGA